jgi:hypothetical protein
MPKRKRNVYLKKLAELYVAAPNRVILDLMLFKYPPKRKKFGPSWRIFFKCISSEISEDATYAEIINRIYKYTGVKIFKRHPPK